MRRRRLAAILVLLFAAACSQDPGPLTHTEGQAGPDFELPLAGSPEGGSVRLGDLTENHTVLLAFWATWCPGCVAEIPVLKEWHEKYAGRGLRILGINIEEPKDAVKEFIEAKDISYPVLLDGEGDVARRYGIAGLPATVVLAKGGKIIYYGFSLPDVEAMLPSADLEPERS